jgi:ergothioneine biosynthesis protein EgtB
MQSSFRSNKASLNSLDFGIEEDLLSALAARFKLIRERTLALCKPLQNEDYGVQPMPDASPPKWHLAHTTWFFETFLLKKYAKGYQSYHPAFEHLFNSYYNGVGDPFPRAQRGALSRPTVAEILAYRKNIDENVLGLTLTAKSDSAGFEIAEILELGLHHEQQHQELLITDIKFNFGHNPLLPRYHETPDQIRDLDQMDLPRTNYIEHDPGLVDIGAGSEFAFDNEFPRHQSFIAPFGIADRLVTNGEYLAFINDGGYQRADLWLAQGWASLQEQSRNHPLYWHLLDAERWHEYRLDGLHRLQMSAPASHISGYEAIAYASWARARLPTEFEWEWAAQGQPPEGNFADNNCFHPLAKRGGEQQFFGDVWEWTSSAYGPYPGYKALGGVLGEYNGKFMSSQLVLRGGSCATDSTHIRPSYRNFFYPQDSWQFTGIRLAVDL